MKGMKKSTMKGMKEMKVLGGVQTLFAVGLAFVAGPPQRGVQLPPHTTPAPAPQFRARVDLVHLDVSVLDKNRHPVTGLGPADFTVLENGVPQTVTVFSEVETPDPAPPKTAWMRDVAPDVRSNADVQQRRLFVIVIDDAALDLDLVSVRNVKTAALRVIDGFGPSDLAAVVFTADSSRAQDFTSDRARLIAAVNAYHAGLRGTVANDVFFRGSANTLQSVVKVLSKLPDRRKAIIYIGQGRPLDLSAAFGPEDIAITKPKMANLKDPAAAAADDPGNNSMTGIGGMARLAKLVMDAFADAARANVTIYPIDVCGVRTGAMAERKAVQASEVASAGAPVGGGNKCQPGLEVNYLTNLASATGGRALINTNDFGAGIDAIFEENASYYVLGYQSTDPRMNGKERKLDVRVNRPGVQVRTRSGYVAEKPEDAKRRADARASAIGAALSGVLPKSDLPLQMTAAPFANSGRKDAAVAVILGVYQPIRERTAQAVEKIDLVVVAYNAGGKVAGSARLVGDVIVRPDERGLGHYEALTSISLKPGRYQLRTAADLSSLGTNGSVYYDIDVPDFGEAPLTLSGLLVSAVPAPIAAPRDALQAIVPVVPTSKRAFRAGDQVRVFARAYQGGKQPAAPVTISTRVKSDNDVLVMDRTQPVAPAASADLNLDLPIAVLAPGSYLLVIEAKTATSRVQRELRFTVTR